METVTIIPKKNNPSTLAECRNLSCTPLFSKVLETIILEQLKREVQLGDSQYGGVKGCGTEHFVIDTLNEIFCGLEKKNSAVNVLTIDFSKTFTHFLLDGLG